LVNKVLITGGLGYLGGRIAKYFSDKDYAVILATRKPENKFPKNIPANTLVMQLDYSSDEQLNEAIKGIDTLIHLAGPNIHSSSYDPENIIRYHIKLTERLLRVAKSNNLNKLIYLSTIHVYGKNLKDLVTEDTKPNPVHHFAEAHLAAEKILTAQADNVSVKIIRCSNSFGIPYFENEKCWKLVVNNFCKSAFQNGGLIINSSGQDYRDFISVGDVAQAIHYLMELNNDKGIDDIYNLGSSRSTPIIEIAKKIQKALKDGFDYDCPIIKNKPSNEMNKPKHFILSTEKIKRLGFNSKLGDDEIFSLLNHCKMKYQLVAQ
jgi:UDP-glucose 4-epimerase